MGDGGVLSQHGLGQCTLILRVERWPGQRPAGQVTGGKELEEGEGREVAERGTGLTHRL